MIAESRKGRDILRYETILLDADGTLLDFLRSEREAVGDVLRELGASADEEMIAVYSEINDGLWKELEQGRMQKSVLFYRRFELLFERYGIVADAKETGLRYMKNLSQKGYVLEGATEFCRRLSQGARLYIVTNGTEWIQEGRLADSGLLPYFQEVFISDRIGYPKPKREFFDLVAEQIPNFHKKTTLIVGDSLSSDIAGGINFGIDTCWYNPGNKAIPAEMEGKITMVARSFDEMLTYIAEGADR